MTNDNDKRQTAKRQNDKRQNDKTTNGKTTNGKNDKRQTANYKRPKRPDTPAFRNARARVGGGDDAARATWDRCLAGLR